MQTAVFDSTLLSFGAKYSFMPTTQMTQHSYHSFSVFIFLIHKKLRAISKWQPIRPATILPNCVDISQLPCVNKLQETHA